jgi:ketosteroid isomerase-like protein
MSEQNVELVRRSLEHWRDGRPEWVDTIDPDIEWDITAHPLPDWPKTGRGRDAFVGHVTDYLSGWNDYEPRVKELIDGGDEVVSIVHERARMRGSETMLDRDLPTVWTVRDGRSVRFRVFKTREDALEAVGLPTGQDWPGSQSRR